MPTWGAASLHRQAARRPTHPPPRSAGATGGVGGVGTAAAGRGSSKSLFVSSSQVVVLNAPVYDPTSPTGTSIGTVGYNSFSGAQRVRWQTQ